MRTRNAVMLGVAISVILSLIVSSVARPVFTGLREDVWHTNVLSNVVAPMSVVIDDLEQTVRDGDCDLVAKKLAILSDRWQEFRRGGDVPSGFVTRIVEMEREQRAAE